LRTHSPTTLVAIPVYNEEKYVSGVLAKVLTHSPSVLVVDDGSTDRTPYLLPDYPVDVLRHGVNRGYGRSLRDAFMFAITSKFDWLITMDCDEQHEPAAIPQFIESAMKGDADVVSGSRYLVPSLSTDHPPPERRSINATITAELNSRLSSRLGTNLTDGFCGFKAYRVRALRKLRPTVNGYAFPMQFWVQCAAAGLKVKELPVKLIYNDPNRTFGGNLDNAGTRLAHYRRVMHRELVKRRADLPACAVEGLAVREGEQEKPEIRTCGHCGTSRDDSSTRV
jgi:glycosyltransferase involved in cell wall biosynthesis